MLLSRMPTGEPEIFASIQGEGFSLGVPSVFVRVAECNLQCNWCFVPETPVLLANWTWKPIGEVRPGENVVGIEQPSQRGAHVKLASTTVTRISRRCASTVIVNGSVRTTPDHKFWLTGRDNHGRAGAVPSGWREIERATGLRVLFTTDPVEHRRASYERGWLAGMADGDGCFWTLKFRRGFRLALNDHALLERAFEYASRAGFNLRWGRHTATGVDGEQRKMECLWLTSDSFAKAFEAWLDEDLDDDSWRAGYLGGILDAEGSHSHAVLRISQDYVNAETRRRISAVLDELGVAHTIEPLGFYIHRTNGSGLRALALSQPGKASLIEDLWGHHPHASRAIESVTATGMIEEVVTLTTTSGSYVAAGYVVKNCDTKYTWDWENYERSTEVLDWPIDDVQRQIRSLAGTGIRNVVLTGGEPLLHQADLATLATRLREEGFRIEVETNGAIEPSPELIVLIDQWNVSPKLESSGNKKTARLRTGPLTRFAALPNATFKFVAYGEADLDEIESIAKTYALPRDRILVMPEATTPAALIERSRSLVPLCQARGLRFGTRLHVALWGDGRGR